MPHKFVGVAAVATTLLQIPGYAAEHVPPFLGKYACAPMQWVADATGPRAALRTVVKLNGRSYWFQLDTGADATNFYGQESNERGWTRGDERLLSPRSFEAGGARLSGMLLLINRDLKSDEVTSGTLGLDAFIGRIAAIDFAGQRLCLLPRYADLGAYKQRVRWSPAILRDGKLFVPVQVGDTVSEDLFFDSGSSLFPLTVDLPEWRSLTGLTDPAAAPSVLRGNQWGHEKVWRGAPARAPITIGQVIAKDALVYVDEAVPDFFAKFPFRAQGNFGNAMVWDHTVLINLSGAHPRFGLGD